MSLREAVERAGSLDALLPLLVQGHILARATSFQEWPSGAPMKLPSLDIDSIWWGAVRSIDPVAGRVCFAMDFFEVMAIGVALERAAVEATWPAKASAKQRTKRKPGPKQYAAWDQLLPHLDFLFENGTIANTEDAFHEAKNWLEKQKLVWTDKTIREGITRNRPDWPQA